MKKRVFAVVLCLMMLLTMVPATALAADCSHDKDLSSTEIASGEATITESGSYYLSDNMTAAGILNIGDGTNAVEVTLCLNGKTLDMAEYHVEVKANAALTICDCGENGTLSGASKTQGSAIFNKGTVTINGGTISTTSTNGIYMNSYGCEKEPEIIVNGGEIIATTLSYSRGIYTNGGKIIVNGGKIVGAEKGVYVNDYATLTVNGGEISGEENGVESYGIVNAIGGTITGAKGIYNQYGMVNVSGTAKILGKEYVDGSKTYCGVGVFNSGGEVTVTGGEIGIVEGETGVGIVNRWSEGLYISGGTINSGIGADTCLFYESNEGVDFNLSHCAIFDMAGEVYLSGTPTIDGYYSDICLQYNTIEMSEDGEVYSAVDESMLSAMDKDNTASYSGEKLVIDYIVYTNSQSYGGDYYKQDMTYPATDAVIVNNCAKRSLFTLKNAEYGLYVSEGNLLIADAASIPHQHEYSEEWSQDATNHWHECLVDGCDGTKDSNGAHVYDNDSDTTCNTCGYVRTITNTKVDIEISKDTPVGDVNGIESAYDTIVTENNKGYTAADKAVVEAGGTAKIYLTANPIAKETDGIKAINAKAEKEGFVRGSILDLSVYKDITPHGGTTSTTKLIELPSIIEVVIDIPENEQGMYNYVIYRYHEGGVDVINTTKNTDGEYIEVSKDGKQITLHIKKFSEYAIGYTTAAQIPNKGDNTLSYVMALIGGCVVVAYTGKKRFTV